jgi:hypothetical protein
MRRFAIIDHPSSYWRVMFPHPSKTDFSPAALRVYSEALAAYCRQLRYDAEQTRWRSQLYRRRAADAAMVSNRCRESARAAQRRQDQRANDGPALMGAADGGIFARCLAIPLRN